MSKIKMVVCLAFGLAAGTCVLLLAAKVPRESRLERFRYDLATADRHLAHALSDSVYLQTYITRPDPYAGILHMRQHADEKLSVIPPAWQARALTRHSAYLRLFASSGGQGHSAKWYREKMLSALRHATRIDPAYGGAWAALAYYYRNDFSALGRAKFERCLAEALRLDPQNANAQGLRAVLIQRQHSGFGIKSGSVFTGNMGFRSRKWTDAFCCRALMYFWCLRQERGKPRFWPPAVPRNWVEISLKYYAPKQLAEVEKGTWIPGPSADPWPPAERRHHAEPSTRK